MTGLKDIVQAIVLLCLIDGTATAAAQQDQPAPYIDNRSGPEEVVRSSYNAIDRGEYPEGVLVLGAGKRVVRETPFEEFQARFADAASVAVGTAQTEVGAGPSLLRRTGDAARMESERVASL